MNLYAFVGWQPSMGTDPMGLYQKDFHYYVVAYMGLIALEDTNAATRIAFASQFTDDNPETAPVHGLAGLSFVSGENNRRLRYFHFPNISGGAVERESDLASFIVDEAIKSGDDFRMGIALHTLADSFSHEGFAGVWSGANDRGLHVSPEYGHGENLTITLSGPVSPTDQPFSDPERAASAALSVYEALWRYGSAKGIAKSHLTDLQKETLREELVSVFSAFEKNAKSLRANQWEVFLNDPVGSRFGGSRLGRVTTYDSAGRGMNLGTDFESRFISAAAGQRRAVDQYERSLPPRLTAPSRVERFWRAVERFRNPKWPWPWKRD